MTGPALAGLCLICWFIGCLHGAYLREKRTTDRPLLEIIGVRES